MGKISERLEVLFSWYVGLSMNVCRQQPGGGLQGGPAPYRGGRGGHGLLPYRQGGSSGGAASGAGRDRRYRPY